MPTEGTGPGGVRAMRTGGNVFVLLAPPSRAVCENGSHEWSAWRDVGDLDQRYCTKRCGTYEFGTKRVDMSGMPPRPEGPA